MAQQALNAALAKKGLTTVEGDTADIYLWYQAAVNREKELTASGWAYGPGWRRGPVIATASTTTILVGSLALDMYDVAKKAVGLAGHRHQDDRRECSPGDSPDKPGEGIRKTAEELSAGKEVLSESIV